MKTSIIGYPRIGALRELKFVSEKYFRNEITADELLETAKNIRRGNWNVQKENEIDFIPSNDFSFYDNMLDTAVLLNAVPERYKALGLPALDTYFAMARGYQGKNGDVKALAMKKWFNTNYHYMVPEIDDDTEIKLTGTKPFDEFLEAQKNGVKTKPVIIGAFTFLKLARFTGNKTAADFADSVSSVYCEYLSKFAVLGAEWAEFDEPCLVTDLSAEDISLFVSLYKKILSAKAGVKVLLQTYFGDVRDCYTEICGLNFDGIGLDFVEGKKSFELVTENGFPKDKLLFAGVVNGKNIWRNHYGNTVNIISKLKEHCGEIVLNTSCSMLHVPYTLQNESKLPADIKKHFAYAEEKLSELAE
ncbi:MAG: 5-methyltetrahydropteroyltriglutamate--homocysteine S-methyltransferase, partial [Eubacterium sp.]